MRPNPIILMLPTAFAATIGALHAASPARRHDPVAVGATLSEWTIRLTNATVPAGPVSFTVTNGGSIPHAFEVEGNGTERETSLIQPGASATLALTLKPGTYEIYCPVGRDSHKKLGMTLYKKEGAGYKIIRDIWNSSMIPPPLETCQGPPAGPETPGRRPPVRLDEAASAR